MSVRELCCLVPYTGLIIWITYSWTRQFYDHPTYREYLRSDKWKALRKRVLARDKYTCQNCGSKTSLQVHHKTYDRIFNEPMDDLITLCKNCHEKVEKRVDKSRSNVKSTKRKSPAVPARK